MHVYTYLHMFRYSFRAFPVQQTNSNYVSPVVLPRARAAPCRQPDHRSSRMVSLPAQTVHFLCQFASEHGDTVLNLGKYNNLQHGHAANARYLRCPLLHAFSKLSIVQARARTILAGTNPGGCIFSTSSPSTSLTAVFSKLEEAEGGREV